MVAAVPTILASQVKDLPRGQVFRVRLTQALTRMERHTVMYYTANREVVLTLKGGTVVTGKLDEAPSYFAQDQRVWLRIEGRKTRKGIETADIRFWQGYRAPSLGEALGAFLILNANNPAPEDVQEARSIAADM